MREAVERVVDDNPTIGPAREFRRPESLFGSQSTEFNLRGANLSNCLGPDRRVGVLDEPSQRIARGDDAVTQEANVAHDKCAPLP